MLLRDRFSVQEVCLRENGMPKLGTRSRSVWLSWIYLCHDVVTEIPLTANRKLPARGDAAHDFWWLHLQEHHRATSDQLLPGFLMWRIVQPRRDRHPVAGPDL